MAITKEKKQSLIKEYVQDLQEANNLVLIKQSGLSVSTDAEVRKNVRGESGKYNVIRKRLFLRALKEAGYPLINLDQISGSAVAVYSKGDEYAPLKIINKHLKDFKKLKDSKTSFEFLGGWFNKEWKDADYVNELANIPSREELLSKLVWLFNYPIQSLTSVLDQIAKKKIEGGDAAPVAIEETKPEITKQSTPESVEETELEITKQPTSEVEPVESQDLASDLEQDKTE